MKKNFGRKFINYWHHKSPENHHIELVEAPGAVKIFSMLAIDHSGPAMYISKNTYKAYFIVDKPMCELVLEYYIGSTGPTKINTIFNTF